MSKKSQTSASATEKKPPKKIAVFGLGSIGTRHLNNLINLGCGVRGYDPANTTITASYRHELAAWADAAVIATPTFQHFNDLLFSHSYKLPLFIEKPVVKDREELEAPAEGIVMVGYNLRFHHCVQKAREWLGLGNIGRPLWARFTCAQYNKKPAYQRDGVILNWSHEIDLAQHLLGNLNLTAADATEREDIADLTFFAVGSGCQITVHLDYVTKPERRGFMIIGTDGAIEVDLVRRQAFLKSEDGRIKTIFHAEDSFDQNYLDEMAAFLSQLDGNKCPFSCTADEGFSVAELCLEAKEIINERR